MSVVPPGDYVFEITGVVGSTTKTVQFTLKIVDPCLETAILTAYPQTNPDVYYYEPGKVAQFTLEPFTIEPVGFCTATHTCSNLEGLCTID